MKLDLDSLRKKVQGEVDDAKQQSERNNSGYPIVYPGDNGQLIVRLLYNVGSGSVQRRLVRHNAGKGKVACLQPYGEDCPVCQAISNAESLLGKECGAFSKYGYKTRGICYAQIIDHDKNYFTGKDDPKKGDIVILMYPKTVYEKINDMLINAGENLDKLLCENEGIPIVIERSQKKGGYPEYNTYVYPYGTKKSFEDTDEKTGDVLFDELLNNLPNLNDTLVPSYPNDEVRKANSALAEVITQEYVNSSTINPGDDHKIENKPVDPRVSNAADMVSTEESDSISSQDDTVPSEDSKPECFGKHNDSDKKCMLCPLEADCVCA